MKEWHKLLWLIGIFLGAYYIPWESVLIRQAGLEAFMMLQDYARRHVLTCLIPAFFIAGAISVFVSQTAVLKYFGAKANKFLSYSVASVSGSVLAVCSCTVLPLFAGIYTRGAGIGPATAFLYSGPAINVLAIILTARILGLELGIARAVGAIVFSVVIGLAMHFIYRKEELNKANGQKGMPEPEVSRPLWKNAVFFAAMVAILVVANWARSGDVRAVFLCCPGGLSTYTIEGTIVEETESYMRVADRAGGEHLIPMDQLRQVVDVEKNPVYEAISSARWGITVGLLVFFAGMLWLWFDGGELKEWVGASWGFAVQILPLLLIGVLAAGFLLGRPGHEGVIPARWVEAAVGGNSLWANLFAAFAGAFMYFATLTEVPILQGLMGAGMGKGPALALLLAGPALSLPNMLVIRSVMGTQKTIVFVTLVVVMATLSGLIYGAAF